MAAAAPAIVRRPSLPYLSTIEAQVGEKGVTNLARMTLAGEGTAARTAARDKLLENRLMPADGNGNNGKLIEMMMISSAREKFDSLLRGSAKALLAPMIPYNVREAFIAQYNARAASHDRLDDSYVRMKSLLDGLTIGAAFSLLARVIRVVLRVAFFWLSGLVALYNQSCYGSKMSEDKKYNIVAEDFRRIWYEVVDLFAVIGVALASFVNFFAPEAVSLDGLRKYYTDRIDQVRERDITFLNAKMVYEDDKAQARAIKQAAVA